MANSKNDVLSQKGRQILCGSGRVVEKPLVRGGGMLSELLALEQKRDTYRYHPNTGDPVASGEAPKGYI